jgi:hypothetical protein
VSKNNTLKGTNIITIWSAQENMATITVEGGKEQDELG